MSDYGIGSPLIGKISQYSTGLEIEPDLWDAKVGKAFTDGRKT